MPRYEFLCEKCKKPFELAMTISEHGNAKPVSPQWGLADALALEMVPEKLVGGQLGRIAGQETQLEATGETFVSHL